VIGAAALLAAAVVAVVAFSAVAEAIRRARRGARRKDPGEPPQLSDEQDGELWQILRRDGEL